MTATSTAKIPVGAIYLYLMAQAGKLRNMGLEENAIFNALKEFVVTNCADPNYPEAKIKAIATDAANPDPRFKDLGPVEFDFTPRPPVTDPDIARGYLRRLLTKHKTLTKKQLQSGFRCDPVVFNDVWAAMVKSEEIEVIGQNRHGNEIFQMADEMGLTPHQQEAVEKIRALQRHTRLTGFRTTRSVNDIKSGLNAEDLAAVCRVLNADPQ
jgi:hypothetical protein